MSARGGKAQKNAESTTARITLTLTETESQLLAEALGLAGDCVALYFGLDNAGSCLHERAYRVASAALGERATRLEEVIDILDHAEIEERLRQAGIAARKSEAEVRQ